MSLMGHAGLCGFLAKAARASRLFARCLMLPLAVFCVVLCTPVFAQDKAGAEPPPETGLQGFGRLDPDLDVVEGKVLNRATGEPVARALVYTPGYAFATLTDNEGHFEIRFPERDASPQPEPDSSDPENTRREQQWWFLNLRPQGVMVRRPGYLTRYLATRLPPGKNGRAHIDLMLDPEGLIVGHVHLPEADSTERIHLQLYQRFIQDGREYWLARGDFTTWANGEFRFYGLYPGNYKLATTGQTERDPATFNPRDQLYGYPPVFYPNASDLGSAASIRLTAGEEVQADISLARRPYYPVKIPVTNAPAAGEIGVHVYSGNQPSPGYSLEYDAADHAIRGRLPDGEYTLQVWPQPETGVSGVTHFSVHGGPVQGPPLALRPDLSLTANVFPELAQTTKTVVTTGSDTITVEVADSDLRATLYGAEPFPWQDAFSPTAAADEASDTITIHNVRPGRYWLELTSGTGYAVSAKWGGKDVLRQPMEVNTDNASTPIEIVMRNDGATVSGSIAKRHPENPLETEERPWAESTPYIYFLPLSDTAGDFRTAISVDGQTFRLVQIPPGTYRILAFAQQNYDFGRGNPEALKLYEDKGVVVELAPNQTLQLSEPLVLEDQP